MRRIAGGLWLALGITLSLSSCYQTLSPARWRCGQHTYVINPQGAPPGAVAATHAAFAALSAAQGGRITWHYAGTTSDAWANRDRVNVVWRKLDGGRWAMAAPQPWPNQVEWTGGGVFIDPRYPVRVSVIEHELGHIAGLGHSDNSAALMYPYGAERKGGYQPEDLLGLHDLAAECR